MKQDEGKHAIGSIIGERYRLVARLGAGGMGEVYKAEHVTLKRPVAVKFLHRAVNSDPEMAARFEREAMAAADIDHPNVARAFDFGTLPDGTLYLAMEYVEGETLGRTLKRTPKLPPERAARILRQVGAGLARAHAKGIVHRDVKPDNVILGASDGETDVVKVVDFGIARVRGGTMASGGVALTQAGVVFGTPSYLSPEQAMGQPVDARADQYALGVMAFQMLTGRLPFVAAEPVELLQKHLLEDVPRATEIAPELPRAVDTVLARMLAKRPSERYESVAAATTALGEALEGAAHAPAATGVTGAIAPVSTPELVDAPTMRSGPVNADVPRVVARESVEPAKATAVEPAGGRASVEARAPRGGAAPGSNRTGMLVGGGLALVGISILVGYLALKGGASSSRASTTATADAGATTRPTTTPTTAPVTTTTPDVPAPTTAATPRLRARGPCRDGQCVCRDNMRCNYVCGDEPCRTLCERMGDCSAQCGEDCTMQCRDGQRCNLRCGGDCNVQCSNVRECRVQCTDHCQVDCSRMMGCVVRMVSGEATCGERTGGCDVQCVFPDGHFERASRCGRGRYHCPPGPC